MILIIPMAQILDCFMVATLDKMLLFGEHEFVNTHGSDIYDVFVLVDVHHCKTLHTTSDDVMFVDWVSLFPL